MQKDNKQLVRLYIDLQVIKLERKQNEYYNKKEDINKIKNLIIDYMNETHERRLDSFTYKFFQDETLEEYIKWRIEKNWAWYIIRQLKGIDEFADRYYFDWYENLQYADNDDVKDRLDDIIREIENH